VLLGGEQNEGKALVKWSSDRGLNCLFAGQLVSQMGDSMYMIGLMWLVLDLTGSKAAMGTVATLSYLPVLVFGLFGGIVADLYNRRRIMLAADALRALVVLVLPIAMLYGTINLWTIYAVTFALAMGIAFFNPARDAIIPELVPQDRLVRGNSMIQSSHYAAMLLGPALAAALLSVVSLRSLFAIDAATFAVSFIAIFMIRYRPVANHEHARLTATRHFGEVVCVVMKDNRLRFLLVLTSVNNFFIMGPAIVGTPVFIKELLRGDAKDYALVESALGLGMVVGVVLINYTNRLIGKGKLLLLGMIFDGLTHALLYFCGSMEGMVALIALHAIGIPFIVVSRTALVQEWVPSGMRGRIFGLVGMAVVGTTSISTGVVGILAESVPVNTIFCIFGICAALCGAAGWCYLQLRDS
jgi:MFS family permease